MTTRFVLLSIILGLSGCTPPSIAPPAAPTHERSVAFEQSFDVVWSRAVDWFAESNIPIAQIERASGLITSEHQLRTGEDLLDCGVVSSGDAALVDSSQTANVNVRVRDEAGGVTVLVDVFGRGSFTFFDAFASSRVTLTAPRCESTGELEASIFRYIQAPEGAL